MPPVAPAPAPVPSVAPVVDPASPPRRTTDLPPAQLVAGDLVEHPARPGDLVPVAAPPTITAAGRVSVPITGAPPLDLDPAVLVRAAVNRTIKPQGTT